MNKRRSTYCELSPREARTMRSMRPAQWLRPSRSPRASILARFPQSSPAAITPAGAALSESPEPEQDRSMGLVIVIAVAVTVLALSALVGTEVVLRALGRTSFVSEFVGSATANPRFVYDLILVAIALLAASLGTAFLLVSAVVGARLERRQAIMRGSDAGMRGSDAGAAAGGPLETATN